MARLLVYVCVALVVLQGANSAMPSLKEIVEKIKDDVTRIVSGAVSKAQEVIIEIEDPVQKLVVKEFTKLEDSIFDFKQKIHQQAQTIVDKAEAEGKLVEKCVEQFGSGIDALKKKGEDAIGCISNPLLEIKNLTEDLTHSVLSINETLTEGQEGLELCKKTGGVFEQTACQIQAGGTLLSTAASASTHIFSIISQLTDLVTKLPTSFQSCEKDVWTNTTMLAANNLSNLTLCIKAQ